jgi:hypothetical protein
MAGFVCRKCGVCALVHANVHRTYCRRWK